MARLSLAIGNKKLALDHGKGDLIYLSHAHSDHVIGMKRVKKIISNKETIELAKLKAKQIKYGKLYNAGHILGSSQLFLENDGESCLYTGDIRTRDSILFKGAEKIKADHLIIETTFAKPYFKFPNYWDVYHDIQKWVKQNENKIILFGAYNLGKAQELTKILNEIGIAPLVSKEAHYYNTIYKKHGINLEWLETKEENLKPPFVSIVPMKFAKKSFAKKIKETYKKEVVVAIASGWSKVIKFKVDKAFILSDHADFYDLASFIDYTEPKYISYVYGDGKKLHEYVKKKLPNLKIK